MTFDLNGKVILVTAGTSALGSEIVRRAIGAGARVFFTYFQNEARARELEGAGGRAYQVDLRKIEDIDRLKEAFRKESPLLDGLVNNAGIVRDRTIAKMTVGEFDEVVNVNLTAVFRITKRFLPLIYRSASGKIVNITSRVGMRGGFGESNYAAAKAGVVAFTKSVAREVGRKGICVNAVAPGFMMSAMSTSLPEPVYERQRAESALGTLTEPGEVADFVLYLLSEAVRGVTGQLFYVDSRSTRIF